MKRCVAVLLLSVITAGVLFGCSSVPKEELYPPEIKMGMTVDEVRAIAGEDGIYAEVEMSDWNNLYYKVYPILNNLPGGITYWFDENGKLIEISIFTFANDMDWNPVDDEESAKQLKDYLTRKFGKPGLEDKNYATWGVKDRDVMFTLYLSDARIVVERYNPYFCNEEPE